MLLTVSGCAVGTGVRVEGKAAPEPVQAPPAAVPSGAAPTIDPVRVLREDRTVSRRIKDALNRPCAGGYAEGWYPIYLRYATIPGTRVPVALITVQGCRDVVACGGSLGAYAYRIMGDGRAALVYAAQESGSRIEVGRHMLVLNRPGYRRDDAPACPTGTRWAGLHWTGGKLVPDSA